MFQLENLAPDDEIPVDVREWITPYLCESGLDVNVLNSDRKQIIQGLMVYHVIDKRKRELDDIAKGKGFFESLYYCICTCITVSLRFSVI